VACLSTVETIGDLAGLLARCADGDQTAVRRIYDDHAPV
jgi:hypothetical protein